MPTTVRLDAKTESLLERMARKKGLSKSQVIRDAIRRLADSEGGAEPPETMAEAIAHLVGCGDSGGARLSEHTGRAFRDLLLARRRERRPR